MEFAQCKCLSGKEKHAIQFAVEDKAFYYEEREKALRREIARIPLHAKDNDNWISKNEQYQKGLVTARDLASDYFPSSIVADELNAMGAYYRVIAKALGDIPAC